MTLILFHWGSAWPKPAWGRSYQGFDFGEVRYGESRLVFVPVDVRFAKFNGSVFPICLESVYGGLALGCCGVSGLVW